jgi:hypothetical protein
LRYIPSYWISFKDLLVQFLEEDGMNIQHTMIMPMLLGHHPQQFFFIYGILLNIRLNIELLRDGEIAS